MPIDRTQFNLLVDDDGTNTYGTKWNKQKIKDVILDPADAAIAAAAAGPHASSHQNGGADGISVAGLSGVLADAQTPTAHASSHQNGGADEMSVAGLSGLLADGQTPLAHKTSHQSGGSDAIKLDDLSAPDDNTDLNASSSAHGLLSKLPGGTTNFLRADGAWAAPPGGGGSADGAGVRQSFRGLHLRTHPDYDVAHKKVLLAHADEIILSDGTRITPADALVADITVSGIGGLRASQSEAASTWYKSLIGYGGSGTGLWLERAKNHALDQSYTGGTGSYFSLRGTTITEIGQSFQSTNAGAVPFVDVLLLRVGSVSGRIWFTLQADASGAPSGTPLATSDKFNAAAISTTMLWVRIPFRVPATIAASTTYHLVMHGDYTQSDTVQIRWIADTTGYAGGSVQYYLGAWNTNSSYDLNFKLYVTLNDNVPAPPAGYDTGYAHLGWVYNDSGSNFVPFVSVDRLVRHLGTTGQSPGAVTSTVATLVDFSSMFLPPVPVAVEFAGYNDTNGARVIVSGVPDGFEVTGSHGLTLGTAVFLSPSGNNTVIAGSSFTTTELQAAYVASSAGNGYVYARAFQW